MRDLPVAEVILCLIVWTEGKQYRRFYISEEKNIRPMFQLLSG